jgi:hypothetical protein
VKLLLVLIFTDSIFCVSPWVLSKILWTWLYSKWSENNVIFMQWFNMQQHSMPCATSTIMVISIFLLKLWNRCIWGKQLQQWWSSSHM